MKRILVAVFSIMILLGTATTALAGKSLKAQVNIDGKDTSLYCVNVNLDGKDIESDVPAVNYEDRTLVPIRFVSESLGAKVEWNKESRAAIIKTSDKIIEIKIDSSKVTINGKTQDIPYKVPAKLMSTKSSESARTMVPLRFISEILGAQVKWIPETSTASINSKVIASNQLKGIESETINGRQAIVIKNSHTPEISKFKLSNPDRLVVDLRNTNLNNVSSYIKTDMVKEIRTNQYKGKEYDSTEEVSRIVFDISENYEKPDIKTEKQGNDIIVYVEATKKAPVVLPPPVVIPPTRPEPKPDGQGKLIVIDAGHGGHDPGASSVNKITNERELTTPVAEKLRDKLEQLGYRVIMTKQNKNEFLELVDRANVANNNNADAFISIHFNTAGSQSATGIETYYSSKSKSTVKLYDDYAFAASIQKGLIEATGERDRGAKNAGFAVTRHTKTYAALAELGFISNPNDEKRITTDEYLEKCAKGIANGIHEFFTKKTPQ